MASCERPQIKYTQLFINGQFVDGVDKKTFGTSDPSTEKEICQVSQAFKADVDLAVEAAKKAMHRKSEWRTMDPSKRANLLFKLASFIERDRDYISKLEAYDVGKTVDSAQGDISFAIKVLRHYAGWVDKIHGKTLAMDGKSMGFTRREPVGVVGAITPWNYPFLLAVLKLAPALCCGNSLVLKPAEQTPLSALYLAALCKEAGFPAGVVNILPGFGPTAGKSITEHPHVDAITFTGSTEVGQLIMQAAAINIKRVKVELGGKSPLIIFDDADLELAAQIAHEACMVNHGQCCCAGTRTYVQAGIYDKMVELFKTMAENRTVGDQFADMTIQGPQVSQEQFDTVMGYIEQGKKEGARLVCGGKRVGDKGYFIQPTVFADVKDNMKIAKEEIFGPVQSILKFETLDEVLDRANDSTYGLAAGVVTKDMDKAMVCAQALQAGSVWINQYMNIQSNTPFGGYKMSGKGREYGEEGLDFFLETKTFTMPVSLRI